MLTNKFNQNSFKMFQIWHMNTTSTLRVYFTNYVQTEYKKQKNDAKVQFYTKQIGALE
jgi:hypothetical protein